MPRLTVSMPARNTERYIGPAIESVLAQTFADFELVVVDDASGDRTAGVAGSFGDPRIRLLRNSVRRGIAGCHNMILRATDSELVTHVDSDDLLLPDGLRRMVAAMDGHPDAPGAHCFYDFIDAGGRPLSDRFTRSRLAVQQTRGTKRDYRRELIVSGMECANHLRTYRRSVLVEFGGFDESLARGEDLEMALRLVDRAPLALVPEVLYLKRIHPGAATESLRLQGLRFWRDRTRIAWRLWRSGRIRYPDQPDYSLPRLAAAGLLTTLGQMAAHLAPAGRRGHPEAGSSVGPS